jgi:hypothetical protein
MEKPEEKVSSNARKADLIMVGRVKSVGAPPGGWSGAYAAWQGVEYTIVRYLKKPQKEITATSVTVFHPVVGKSRTADEAQPRLRESIFRPGAELILLIRQKDSRLETFDENFGVLPNDPRAVEMITRALDSNPAPA